MLKDSLTHSETIVTRCFATIEAMRNRVNIALLRARGCVIGTGVTIEKWAIFKWRVSIGDGTKILGGARIENSIIGKNCEIGGEVKRSHLWDDVKAKHQCVILNAHIGDHSNIAAGVVFGNYNGIGKGFFELGEGVFVGANSTIVFKSETEDRIIGDWSYIPENTGIECDLPEFWRFIPSDRYKNPQTDDIPISGWYIRPQSKINIARKSKQNK